MGQYWFALWCLSSFVTLWACLARGWATLHSGPVVLRPIMATPGYITFLAASLVDTSKSWSTNSGGLTMRQWRHEPPAPISGPKNRPRIPTQFIYLRLLIFIITPFGHRQRQCYTYRRKAKIDSSLCSRMPYRLYRYYVRRNARTTFSMPECAKTSIQQCRISKFFRGTTPGPMTCFRGRVVNALGRHVQQRVTRSVAGVRLGRARPPTKELFLMIPMHMMNRELIPGR